MEPILYISISSLVIFLAVFLVSKQFFNNEQNKRLFELKLNSQKTTLPAKIQSYERLVLLIERLAIEKLLTRFNLNTISAEQLHRSLLKTIQEEFEHNITQQIYVSIQTWEVLKQYKKTSIQLINNAFKEVINEHKLNGKDKIKTLPALVLGKKIVDTFIKEEPNITKITLHVLKKEVSKYL